MWKRSPSPILLALVGLLFMFAGVRDLFWPGFLSFRMVTSSHLDSALKLVGGMLFLIMAWHRTKVNSARGKL